ncbi:MAG: GNAT family N-acetyltransferase [Clostridiales Family XIII bacterium]|nr:GNAT family N-acetyltransferase [Clostridiales Family XIII bacterium]
MRDIAVNETEDYEWLIELFKRNGLEVPDEDEVPTDLVAQWEAVSGGERVGGCVLALREGRHIIDGIAVEEPFRGRGIGEALLGRAIDEMARRGGTELFLVARAPGFFRKQGFVETPREEAPVFFECFGCPQYGVDCFPEVMRYRRNLKLTNNGANPLPFSRE